MGTVGDRIRELRKALNLTQADLADRIDVSFASISKFETNERAVTDRNLRALCREFHVRREWLLDGEGDTFLPQDEDEELIDRVLSGTDRNSKIISALVKGIVKMPGGWDVLAKAVESAHNELKKLDD